MLLPSSLLPPPSSPPSRARNCRLCGKPRQASCQPSKAGCNHFVRFSRRRRRFCAKLVPWRFSLRFLEGLFFKRVIAAAASHFAIRGAKWKNDFRGMSSFIICGNASSSRSDLIITCGYLHIGRLLHPTRGMGCNYNILIE